MFDSSYFDDKTILITGGSGSIGSYLVDMLVKTNCKSIRVLSNNEHELYQLQKKHDKNPKLRYLLGDVRDKERLVVATDGVDFVYHAAALKHVPICEYNPLDAVRTNVIGTQNILEACMRSKIEKFSFISTDKAASPMSTLGATKLLAERLTISSMAYSSASQPISYCVRFGNVLGSRGSVFDLFYDQIKNGKPITVTDKRMTRFTMTHNEAANLILSTTKLAKGSEVFVLKMKVMKTIDLVEAMIDLFGNGKEFKIIETGIRHGEKMHEELITEEEGVRAREFHDMYVIPPYDSNIYEKYPKLKSPYSSNSIEPMNKEEIKKFIQQIPNENLSN